MKQLIFIFLLFTACEDFTDYNFKECYLIYDMKCEDNKAMMCEEDYMFWTYQDCNVIGKTCVFNEPELQGGYAHIATCEDIDHL